MIDPDDQVPAPKKERPEDLETLSVAELEQRIAELEAEIEKLRAAIKAKQAHRTGADALFRK